MIILSGSNKSENKKWVIYIKQTNKVKNKFFLVILKRKTYIF